MQLVIPDGYGLVTYHHDSPNFDGEAIFSFGVDLNAVIPDDVLVGNLYYDYRINFIPAYTPDIGLQRCRLLYRLGGVLQANEHVEQTLGNQLGESAPSNCAALVSKKTALVGRKFRGRAYFPPGPTSELNTPALWHSSWIVKVQTCADGILDGYDTRGMTGVILHSDVTPPTPISSVRAQTRIATQRGRLRD